MGYRLYRSGAKVKQKDLSSVEPDYQ